MNNNCIINIIGIILVAAGLYFIISNLIELFKINNDIKKIENDYREIDKCCTKSITEINKEIDNLVSKETSLDIFSKIVHLEQAKRDKRLILDDALMTYKNETIKKIDTRGKCIGVILLSVTEILLVIYCIELFIK